MATTQGDDRGTIHSWTPGPVVGWRRWTVAPGSASDGFGGAVLRGATGWTWPSPHVTARCHFPTGAVSHLFGAVEGHGRLGRHNESAPAVGCVCGVHAYAMSVPPSRWPSTTPSVTAAVELTGTVIEHRLGYRAAGAHILPPLCLDIACRRCRRPAEWVSRTHHLYDISCGIHRTPGAVRLDVWLEAAVPAIERRYESPLLIRSEERRIA